MKVSARADTFQHQHHLCRLYFLFTLSVALDPTPRPSKKKKKKKHCKYYYLPHRPARTSQTAPGLWWRDPWPPAPRSSPIHPDSTSWETGVCHCTASLSQAEWFPGWVQTATVDLLNTPDLSSFFLLCLLIYFPPLGPRLVFSLQSGGQTLLFSSKIQEKKKVGDFASLSRCPLFSPIPCWRPCCWSYRLHRRLGRSFKNCLTCLFFCPSSLSLQLQVRGQSWNLGMCSVWVLWQWLSGSECCEGEKKVKEGGREGEADDKERAKGWAGDGIGRKWEGGRIMERGERKERERERGTHAKLTHTHSLQWAVSLWRYGLTSMILTSLICLMFFRVRGGEF